MQWFEKCKCGKFVNTGHDCIYTNKDMMISHLEQQKAELIEKLEQYYKHFCDFKYCKSTCKNLKCTDKAELKTFINKYK